MNERTSAIGCGGLFGLFLCVMFLLVAKWFIFDPFQKALNNRVTITVAPTAWHLEAACPKCGNLWTIDAEAKR